MSPAGMLLGVFLSVAMVTGSEQSTAKGPHGGQVVKISDELQVELVAQEKTLNIYILDQAARSLTADQLKKLKVKVMIQTKGETERELKADQVEDHLVGKYSVGATPARVKVDVKVGFHGHSATFELPQGQK